MAETIEKRTESSSGGGRMDPRGYAAPPGNAKPVSNRRPDELMRKNAASQGVAARSGNC